MIDISEIVQWIGTGVEALGVGVILTGILGGSCRFIRAFSSGEAAYNLYRRSIGRAILLGLEILVAGDIIKTVTVDPSLESVLGLALIVVVRTFLSWSIEVELHGRWPWQRNP